MAKGFGGGLAAALAIGAIVAAGGVAAHEVGKVPNTPGGRAAAARHDNFRQIGGANKAISDELKKDAPAKAVLTSNAAKLVTLSGQVPGWFPRGSGPESGANTDAKANIWTDAAGFAAANKRFQTEAAKFQQVANSGDMNAIRTQARAVGGSCKGCHDKYRVERD